MSEKQDSAGIIGIAEKVSRPCDRQNQAALPRKRENRPRKRENRPSKRENRPSKREQGIQCGSAPWAGLVKFAGCVCGGMTMSSAFRWGMGDNPRRPAVVSRFDSTFRLSESER
ncbi:MAG: hypothetical protein CBB71_01935 [Rhodopirellula sp. TMED11]|nr:MAG: hypothetical protein CBB71_01935 [Rhodopirellula sp. TMED11]